MNVFVFFCIYIYIYNLSHGFFFIYLYKDMKNNFIIEKNTHKNNDEGDNDYNNIHRNNNGITKII